VNELVSGNRKIKEITGGKLDTSVAIIRRAFGKVAEAMGITEASAPPFPAYTTVPKLDELRTRGAVFFGLFVNGKQAGFVAVEKENDAKYYMKRLAVLPEFWHGGYGRELVNYAIEYVKNKGNNKLHLTIVNENPVLKNWYLGMGFKETSVQKFERLPFTVSFMELDIT
jgi:GNAT superfamily N-acetyltransferase